MNLATRWCCLVEALSGVLWLAAGPATAEMPAPPKVSTFAPAQDLVNQLEEYVSDLEKSVKDQEEYADSKDKVAKDADTVLLIALALGLHDSPNKYKSAAPGLVAAAKQVSAATDYQTAAAAVGELKAALHARGNSPSELSWQDAQSASLEALMKQVPLVNTKMKRYLRGARFKSKADDTAGHTAVLAAIAQGSMALADKTEKPSEAEKWYAFCAQMRQAAADLNKAIRDQDQDAATKGVKNLTQSCDDCHAVFHPEAEKESGKEED